MNDSPMKKIRVVLADDHPIVRSGIRAELGRHSDVEFVGEAVNGNEVLTLVGQAQPDVLLLDINMPGLRAVDIVRRLRERSPSLRVVVLSAYGDDEHVIALLSAGARGYVLKDEEPTSVVEAIRAVTQGILWLSPGIASVVERTAAQVVGNVSEKQLSPREMDVLRMMALGWDNQKIAQALDITEATVKFHVSHVYDKLGVTSRVEAVLFAVRQGWVEPDSK